MRWDRGSTHPYPSKSVIESHCVQHFRCICDASTVAPLFRTQKFTRLCSASFAMSCTVLLDQAVMLSVLFPCLWALLLSCADSGIHHLARSLGFLVSYAVRYSFETYCSSRVSYQQPHLGLCLISLLFGATPRQCVRTYWPVKSFLSGCHSECASSCYSKCSQPSFSRSLHRAFPWWSTMTTFLCHTAPWWPSPAVPWSHKSCAMNWSLPASLIAFHFWSQLLDLMTVLSD